LKRLVEDSRVFWAATGLLLAYMGVVLVTTSRKESQTWDEAVHLMAGYLYWKTGDFEVNWEHPPLGKLLAAAPLLVLNPRLPLEHEAWRARDFFGLAKIFLYKNRVPADTLLLAGRLPTMALALMLGAVLAVWTRRRFGAGPALLALFLYSLDPNLIAHGRYVTTDLIATLMIFSAVAAWTRFLETGRRRDLVLAGVVLGLALAAKYSALFLLGLFPLLDLLWRRRLGGCIRAWGAAAAVAGAVVALVYWPETRRALAGEKWALFESTFPDTRFARALIWFGEKTRVPGHAYVLGFDALVRTESGGRPSYVLGQVSRRGFWYYFPVAFAVKTPSAVLALLAISLALGVARLIRCGWRGVRPAWLALLAAPAVYFLLSILAGINIGLRHILPVYPFLFALVAASCWRRRLAPVLVILAGVHMYEHAGIYPHYLAFFNLPAGGAENGPRYLVDSNIDWGQDLKKLKTYLDAQGAGEVRLSYFGTADPAYYGLRVLDVPFTDDPYGRDSVDAIVAVSVTLLQGVYTPDGRYDWLRELEPSARIGYSIYAYDLRKRPPAAPERTGRSPEGSGGLDATVRSETSGPRRPRRRACKSRLRNRSG
jgi:4-amino-4-deoxy-L-arabinose transferase-like glycosyltransferase